MSYLNVVGCADANVWLVQLPANSIDSVVTDPPAGIGFMGKEWDTPDVSSTHKKPAHAVEAIKKNGGHFPDQNGKGGTTIAERTAFVASIESIMRACYRVLKPGGHALVWALPRTSHWTAWAIQNAGFEVRDVGVHLYGSGFPKSHDVSKAIDAHLTGGRSDSVGLKKTNDDVRAGTGRTRKKSHNNGIIVGAQTTEVGERTIRDEPATEEGARWKGWGTALKPASEHWICARKPLDDDETVATNTLKWGTGGINIDACRIGTTKNVPAPISKNKTREVYGKYVGETGTESGHDPNVGRWPANLTLAHSDGCVRAGTKRVKGHAGYPNGPGGKSMHYASEAKSADVRPDAWAGHADADGLETVEAWRCVDGCPIKLLDEQSGVSKSSGGRIGNKEGVMTKLGSTGWVGTHEAGDPGFGDTGGASRFFYTAKAAAKEKWHYCRRCQVVFQRTDEAEKDSHAPHAEDVIAHPTPKPIDLMEWLIRLVTPAGGIVLDPFCGTGTTAVAAKKNGFNFVTCDLDENYVKIAQARLASVSMTDASRTSAGYFCPGCKAKGEIKLLDKSTVEVAKAAGKKITCTKCMGRFTAADLGVKA